jgi:hypothetical protein
MKQEGDRKICQFCKLQGINTEIICKKIIFEGEERLSWRNPDGSAHFSPIEDKDHHVTFEHTPTVKTALEVWQMEIEEKIREIQRQVGIQCLE